MMPPEASMTSAVAAADNHTKVVITTSTEVGRTLVTHVEVSDDATTWLRQTEGTNNFSQTLDVAGKFYRVNLENGAVKNLVSVIARFYE
jgi:hypothetical protein